MHALSEKSQIYSATYCMIFTYTTRHNWQICSYLDKNSVRPVWGRLGGGLAIIGQNEGIPWHNGIIPCQNYRGVSTAFAFNIHKVMHQKE